MVANVLQQCSYPRAQIQDIVTALVEPFPSWMTLQRTAKIVALLGRFTHYSPYGWHALQGPREVRTASAFTLAALLRSLVAIGQPDLDHFCNPAATVIRRIPQRG